MTNTRLVVGGLILANVAAIAVGITYWGRTPEGQEPVSDTILTGHTYWVRAVAFSPDGLTLAAAGGVLGKAGEVKLWDLQTGRERATLATHPETVEAVAFSPDGRVLATATFDNTIRLWDVDSLRPLKTLHGGGERVYSLTFSADGRTVISASYDDMVCVWDVAQGKQRTAVRASSGPKALGVGGKTLAVASPADRTVQVLELASGRKRSGKTRHNNKPFCVAIAPDGKTLATADAGGRVYLWDAATLELCSTLGGHQSPVISLAFSPNGKTLASGSVGRTVKLWDVAAGKVQATLRGHDGAVAAVAFAPGGRTLASGSFDKTVRLWGLTAVQ
jgi:WD40 repeat protein